MTFFIQTSNISWKTGWERKFFSESFRIVVTNTNIPLPSDEFYVQYVRRLHTQPIKVFRGKSFEYLLASFSWLWGTNYLNSFTDFLSFRHSTFPNLITPSSYIYSLHLLLRSSASSGGAFCVLHLHLLGDSTAREGCQADRSPAFYLSGIPFSPYTQLSSA